MAIGRTRRETGTGEPVRERPADGTTDETTVNDPVVGEARARDRFGGPNWGAAFFGWIVAIGITVLLTGIIGAIATAVGDSNDVTQSDAQRAAGTVTIVTAIVLLVVLMVAYYAGGYVAGRMSRFDGARQGLAVWILGLVITILAVVLGWIAGDQYNVLDRVSLPRVPIPKDDVTLGSIIAAIVVLVGTLLAAMLGGKVGTHYHRRVDREF